MSRKNLIPSTTPPDWANQLTKLRKRLKLSQTELAKRLNVSAMTCSRWERGEQPPNTDCYLELGRLAGPQQAWYFWKMAGLRDADLQLLNHHHITANKDRRIAEVITALEGQAALSEAQSNRIAASLFKLPTAALRREFRVMSETDARWSKIMRRQADVLREVYSGKS